MKDKLNKLNRKNRKSKSVYWKLQKWLWLFKCRKGRKLCQFVVQIYWIRIFHSQRIDGNYKQKPPKNCVTPNLQNRHSVNAWVNLKKLELTEMESGMKIPYKDHQKLKPIEVSKKTKILSLDWSNILTLWLLKIDQTSKQNRRNWRQFKCQQIESSRNSCVK